LASVDPNVKNNFSFFIAKLLMVFLLGKTVFYLVKDAMMTVTSFVRLGGNEIAAKIEFFYLKSMTMIS